MVTQEGIAADPKKVAAVRDFPAPEDLKALRSFVGLASYYRRFIPSFSKVAAPLFELTKKDMPFEWSAACQSAFVSLKEALMNASVLAFPQFGDSFLLETDASGVGLGAVLAQRREDGTTRPIAYASRTLQSHERNYGVTELEALGVVWAVRHFRHYLYGSRCDVFTDHEALKALLNTPHPSGKLARWGLSLQELDLHIQGVATAMPMPYPVTRLEPLTEVAKKLCKWLRYSLAWLQQRAGTLAWPSDKSRTPLWHQFGVTSGMGFYPQRRRQPGDLSLNAHVSASQMTSCIG